MAVVAIQESGSTMRARVLYAAMDLFKALPVSKITMEDVAREAGVVRSTVYKHFKNKDDLLAALFSHEIRTNHHPAIRAMHAEVLSIENLTDMFMAEQALARNYVLLGNTFDPSKIPGIGELVLSSQEIADANKSLWETILQDYIKHKILKSDLDVERTIKWLTYQHVWLISHPDALADSVEERRTYVRTYIFGAMEK